MNAEMSGKVEKGLREWGADDSPETRPTELAIK